MPIIRVEILKGRSSEIKQSLVSEITEVSARHLGVDASHINVMIDEVEPSHWAVGGRFLDAPTHKK
jgi:4-oxalocrotonate tautomerase